MLLVKFTKFCFATVYTEGFVNHNCVMWMYVHPFVAFHIDDADLTTLSNDMSIGRLVSQGQFDKRGDRKRQTLCVTALHKLRTLYR
jgi:hypothetical protein